MNDSNRLLGLITACSGGLIFLLCLNIESIPDTRTLSPNFFPELLAIVLVLLGVSLLVRGGGKPLAGPNGVASRIFQARNAFLVLFTLLYTCLFGYGDYRVNTPLYIAASMWALGVRKPLYFVLVPALTTALMYGLFRHGFTVLLPTLF